jgi:alanine racemase
VNRDHNLVRVRVDTGRIVHNYRLLAELGPPLMPVIKADAYGHGLADVALALADAGASILAVGSVAEAAYLRDILAKAADGTEIDVVALLGPLEDADYPLLAQKRILPMVGRMDQIDRLATQAEASGETLGVALKFDTGMSRLGFAVSEVSPLIERLGDSPQLRVELVCSHLAAADEEDKADTVMRQAGAFANICQALREQGHEFRANLANSAGLLAHGTQLPAEVIELARPGIALYGANPLHGTAWEHLGAGLKPGMSVSAPVLEVRDLAKGACVSYGCTFTAPQAMRLAVVGIGYADGYSRGVSGKGEVVVRGQRASICGRVCMQLIMVDATHIPDVAVGDRAYVLGGEEGAAGQACITPEELAGWWATIPYEVFCILGQNRRE